MVRRTIARRRVSILVYHDPDPAVFARHLDYLARRYNFVRLGDVISAQREDRWDALPDRPLVMTFDDAWRGNHALAQLCRRYACPITIYACSQIIDTARHYWWTETADGQALRRSRSRADSRRFAPARSNRIASMQSARASAGQRRRRCQTSPTSAHTRDFIRS